VQVTAGEEAGRKLFRISSAVRFGADAPPLSCGSRSLPDTIPVVQKAFSAIPGVLGVIL